MIEYSYKLNWKGKVAFAKYRAATEMAVARSALEVQRAAKKLLNKSGKGVTAKLGLNSENNSKKISGAEKTEMRLREGIAKLSGLKTIHSKKNKLTFGGSFKGTSRIYWYREPLHRWVQASQPGTPPHKQSGKLQQIVVKLFRGGTAAKIGPQYGLKYARIQELGGRGMVNLAPRPYMRPAYESVIPQIDGIFKKYLGKAVK